MFQDVLCALTELAELSIAGNPICLSTDDNSPVKLRVLQLLPQLEIIDGVRLHSLITDILSAVGLEMVDLTTSILF